jgi:outer membrane receptor protein involved in Fe transport
VRGTLEVAWRGAFRAPRDWFFIRSNFTDFTPHQQSGYALVNARASYDLPAKVPVRLSLIGTNLLNKRPEETLVGSVNRLAGRAVYAQAEVHF